MPSPTLAACAGCDAVIALGPGFFGKLEAAVVCADCLKALKTHTNGDGQFLFHRKPCPRYLWILNPDTDAQAANTLRSRAILADAFGEKHMGTELGPFLYGLANEWDHHRKRLGLTNPYLKTPEENPKPCD